MKQLRFARNTALLERHRQKKVPLSSVVLPPLLAEDDVQVLERVLVTKPKSGNVGSDMVSRQPEQLPARPPEQPVQRGSEAARVAQLEQNIRFLQEQHQLMLAGLHKEIDNLRHRNRELQFQLVFVKGSVPSSPSSSSEDDTKHKVYSSPKPVNITPLQVELLEKELGELKLHMQDVESQNVYLSAIVEEQKKKLERYERERERERERAAHPDPELLKKLDETEALVRKLHRENSDLRREGSAPSSSYYRRHDQSQQQKQGGPRRGYRGGANWFPPLHSQSYWPQRGGERQAGGAAEGGDATLPNLQGGGGGGFQYQGRRNANNNYRGGGEGRKYRGGQGRGNKAS